MLSIQTEIAQTAQPTSDGYRPQTTADAVGPLFAPVRIGTDLNGLIDEIRQRKDKADFETNRPGMSCVILLARSMGLVEEAEIDQAVMAGWAAVHRLYQEAIANITAHLNQESMGIAGVDLDHSDFEPLYLEMKQSQSEGVLLVLGVSLRFSSFSLLDIDRDLARAVAGCLKWTLFNGGIGILADDLSKDWIMMGDELDALKDALETQGPLGNSELAEFFLENDVYPFNEIADDPEYLEERIGYLQSVLAHNCKSMFGELPEIGEIRRMLAGWRTAHKVLYGTPWVKFIRETIKVCKWLEKSVLKAAERRISPCDYGQGDMCLDYGHVIGFGFDWEEPLVSGLYDEMIQTDENPAGIIRLNPLACSEVGEKLNLLAKSRGLIRLAEVINADEKNQTNQDADMR